MPVPVAPLRSECSQQWRSLFDCGEVVASEVLCEGATGNGASQARAHCDETTKRGQRVAGSDDRGGAREDPRRGRRQREISGGMMKEGQRASGRSGVVETGEGVPRRHVAVEIHASRPLVDLVNEVTVSYHRVTVRGSKDFGE